MGFKIGGMLGMIYICLVINPSVGSLIQGIKRLQGNKMIKGILVLISAIVLIAVGYFVSNRKDRDDQNMYDNNGFICEFTFN